MAGDDAQAEEIGNDIAKYELENDLMYYFDIYTSSKEVDSLENFKYHLKEKVFDSEGCETRNTLEEAFNRYIKEVKEEEFRTQLQLQRQKEYEEKHQEKMF